MRSERGRRRRSLNLVSFFYIIVVVKMKEIEEGRVVC